MVTKLTAAEQNVGVNGMNIICYAIYALLALYHIVPSPGFLWMIFFVLFQVACDHDYIHIITGNFLSCCFMALRKF